LKFTNTASPRRAPKFHILEGTEKIFGDNAPTSSLQTWDQVSANDHVYNLCRTACWLRYLCLYLTNVVRLALIWTSNDLSTRPHTKLTFWPH